MKDLPPTLLCHPFSTPVQISGEGCALSFLPYSKLHFHISFFLQGMWHICISLFSPIRICWLKLNEINSSWWHWICLLSSLNTLHTLDSLITGSRSHTFVSTNVGALPPFSFCWLTVIRQFSARATLLRNLPWIILQSQAYQFCLGSISTISTSSWMFGIRWSFSSPAASVLLMVDPNRSLIEW